MEKIIKFLKSKEAYKQYFAGNPKLTEAVEKLIEGYRELEEENKKLNNTNKTYINCIQNITPVLMEDYIEKSLVEEKIEELIKEGRHYNANKIEVLQELLEKRK